MNIREVASGTSNFISVMGYLVMKRVPSSGYIEVMPNFSVLHHINPGYQDIEP